MVKGNAVWFPGQEIQALGLVITSCLKFCSKENKPLSLGPVLLSPRRLLGHEEQ